MKSLRRIVWSEGMYLGPHHFQAQSRYFEDLVDFATSNLGFEPYGVMGVEVDQEAVRNGTVSLVHARGILPDGLTFNMPECDPVPAARNITELFPPTRTSLGVLLGVPPRKPGGVNTAMAENEARNGVRYMAEPSVMADEISGRDEKAVKLGRKNIQLYLDTEISEDLVTLPIARIMRDGAGRFAVDPDFIPPCLNISASEKLVLMLRQLLDILGEKSSTLAQQGRAASTAASGFSAQEIANAWLLHAANSALASLRHLASAKHPHPEELFVELSRLGGALCTFSLDSHPQQLPLYDHQNLEACFQALDQHIRRHLELIVPSNVVTIEMKKLRDYYWGAELTDSRLFDRSRWFLGIHGRLGEAQLIDLTPKLVKVCSAEFIQKLVSRALPGLTLTHLPAPPAAISPKIEAQYFLIDKAGPCWEHTVKTRKLAMYVPGEIPGPELELIVVLES